MATTTVRELGEEGHFEDNFVSAPGECELGEDQMGAALSLPIRAKKDV